MSSKSKVYLEKENVPITSLRGVCSGRGHPLWQGALPSVIAYHTGCTHTPKNERCKNEPPAYLF
jgi:hypothetical protein